MRSQVGLFIRRDSYSLWEFHGFYDDSKQALLAFNLLELEHEDVECIWFDPAKVFESMTVPKEDE